MKPSFSEKAKQDYVKSKILGLFTDVSIFKDNTKPLMINIKSEPPTVFKSIQGLDLNINPF